MDGLNGGDGRVNYYPPMAIQAETGCDFKHGCIWDKKKSTDFGVGTR